ncbi:MAG: hypothetical protein O2800_01465 [Planctomycetota bacterium]|nr:hypothetical protein [Planctomycetota bacterium]
MRKRSGSSSESPMSFFSFQDIVAGVLGIMILVALLLALDPLSDKIEPVSPAKSAAQSAADAEAVKKARETLEKIQEQIKSAAEALANAQVGEPIELEEVERVEVLARETMDRVVLVRAEEKVVQQSVTDATKRVAKETKALQSIEETVAKARKDVELAERRARVQYRPGDRFERRPLLVELGSSFIRMGILSTDNVPMKEFDGGQGEDTALLTQASNTHPSSDWYLLFVLHPGTETRFESSMREWYGRGYEVGWQLWDPSNGSIFDDPAQAGQP